MNNYDDDDRLTKSNYCPLFITKVVRLTVTFLLFQIFKRFSRLYALYRFKCNVCVLVSICLNSDISIIPNIFGTIQRRKRDIIRV